MDRRLGALALAVPAGVLVAAFFPPVLLVLFVLVPAAGIAWAVRQGTRAWALAMAPGWVAIAVVLSPGLPGFLCAALAGPLVALALRLGRPPLTALVWGVGPFVARTILLAISGFQPFPESVEDAIDAMFAGMAVPGDLSPEGLAELRESTEIALAAMREIWVASEILGFVVSLVLAWALIRRIFPGGDFPPWGRFSRLDLPDLTIWAFIAGLGLVLAAGGAARTVGWNLAFATTVLFVLRGIAIESFWMERGGLGSLTKFGLFAGGVILLLPGFLALTAALGLFDAWFDFRRFRASSTRGNPFALFHRSSADGPKEED